jgi:hypothetical protein
MSCYSTYYKCSGCDYESIKLSNVKRHIVRIHNIEIAPKATDFAPKAMDIASKATDFAPKATDFALSDYCQTNTDNNICKKCNKNFSRKNIMLKHFDKCKGITNSLQCENCYKIFSHRNNKYEHLKICKDKLEKESTTLAVANNDIIQTVEIINNNNTINNNTINNNNNNTINNIIVFDPDKMKLLHDHISKNDIMQYLRSADFSTVLTDYSKALLGRDENQCIRKTNMKSASSSVHVGENKWELQTDKELYPKLMSNIAVNFQDIREEFKIKIANQLDTFLADIECEVIDSHDDKTHELNLKRLHKRLFNNIKHIIFNLTKSNLTKS